MLSVHPLTDGYPVSGWDAREVNRLADVAQIVVAQLSSPCVWSGNYRHEDNFAGAAWLALDYDEGVSIEEACELLAPYSYILGTTKSHQKEKQKSEDSPVKPACDRFRVFLPFDRPLYDLDIFRFNMKLATRFFKSDPQPIDGGRVWQRCRQIVKHQENRAAWSTVDEVPEEETRAYRTAKADEYKALRQHNKTLPPWVAHFMRHGALPGERNKSLYFAACALLEYGWPQREARAKLLKVPGIAAHEKFETTFKSACKRVGQDYDR